MNRAPGWSGKFELTGTAAITVALALALALPAKSLAFAHHVKSVQGRKVARVLLVSIDGAHSSDLVNYISHRPSSALAELFQRGSIYTNARTPVADSAPGLVALFAGATPRVSGVPYIPWFDRNLSAPGSNCSQHGTIVAVSDRYNINPLADDAGGGIDERKLPRDGSKGCSPVWPHALLRVNTTFAVVKAAGGRTAWADQHIAYNDLLGGPRGDQIDDSFSPDGSPARHSASFQRLEDQDRARVRAVQNQIRGFDHTGRFKSGTPQLFGMSFIILNSMQKSSGYQTGTGVPSPDVLKSLDFVDAALSELLQELKTSELYDSTMVIVTSKHGQGPIDPARRRLVDRRIILNIIEKRAPGSANLVVEDAAAYIWLKDRSKTVEISNAIRRAGSEAGVASVRSGRKSIPIFGNAARDPRVPDIIVETIPGTIYALPGDTRLAEHGGFDADNLNVALLLSYPGGTGRVFKAPVSTTQVAPTMLLALGLNPRSLDAVNKQGTSALPGFSYGSVPKEVRSWSWDRHVCAGC